MLFSININQSIEQFYMSLENKIYEEGGSPQESQSKQSSQHKTHQIRKNPRPNGRNGREKIQAQQLKQSMIPEWRINQQHGMFESQNQKQLRIQKFWRQEIDYYYRKVITEDEKQILKSLIESQTATLTDIMNFNHQENWNEKIPFEQLYRYFQLINQSKNTNCSLILIENDDKKYLGVFNEYQQLQKIIEISDQEGYLVTKRESFMKQLEIKQKQYNDIHSTNHKLSEMSSEIAFLLHLLKENKQKYKNKVENLLLKIENQPKTIDLDKVEDNYIAFLMRKNLKIALMNDEIDYLNYYRNLDAYDQIGEEAFDQKLIVDRKQFEQYIKKKRGKRQRKAKGVLKSACAGCLSPHFQQYNPFINCVECQIRFHKYCYTNIDNYCEACHLKKSNISKTRSIQCQLCPNKGFCLSLPMRMMGENTNVHIFCMLINGLWKVDNTQLSFKTSSYVNQNNQNQICTICNSSVYTYKCVKCANYAHPLCAYLKGWLLTLDSQDRVSLECCGDFDKEKYEKRRKFILNYKKCVFKCENDK